jgi:hypothetical protein
VSGPLTRLVARCHDVLAQRAPTSVRDLDLVLAEIAALHDPACIVPLLACFEDRPPYEEAMFSIIHTVENFDDATYVHELLAGTVALMCASPRWAHSLYARVLNSSSARAALLHQLAAADTAVRDAARGVLERIASSDKRASPHAREVLMALA